MSTLKKRKIDWSISSFCHRSITQTLQLEPLQVSPVHTLKILATTFCDFTGKIVCDGWVSFLSEIIHKGLQPNASIYFSKYQYFNLPLQFLHNQQVLSYAPKKGCSTENALCNWLDHPHNSDHLQKMLLCWTVLFATCRLIHIIQIICKKCQFKWALLHFTLAHYAT